MISGQLRNLAAAALVAVSSLAAAAPGDERRAGGLRRLPRRRPDQARALCEEARRPRPHAVGRTTGASPCASKDTPTKDVQAFLDQNADTYVAEVLRGDWLKVLGQRGDWAEFDRQLALYPRDDLEVRCYAALMSAERGQEARLGELDWIVARAAGACPTVARSSSRRCWTKKRSTVTDVWRRVRILFAKGQITAAKTALGDLDKPDSPDERLLADAARRPAWHTTERMLSCAAAMRQSSDVARQWRGYLCSRRGRRRGSLRALAAPSPRTTTSRIGRRCEAAAGRRSSTRLAAAPRRRAGARRASPAVESPRAVLAARDLAFREQDAHPAQTSVTGDLFFVQHLLDELRATVGQLLRLEPHPIQLAESRFLPPLGRHERRVAAHLEVVARIERKLPIEFGPVAALAEDLQPVARAAPRRHKYRRSGPGRACTSFVGVSSRRRATRQ